MRLAVLRQCVRSLGGAIALVVGTVLAVNAEMQAYS